MSRIKSDLIVYYDGSFLVLIKDVDGFISLSEILKRYAEKYGFDLRRLTGTWVNYSFLDYNKDILND